MAVLSALVDDVTQRATLMALLAAAREMLTAAPAADPVSAIGRALLAVTGAPRAAVLFRSPTGFVTCPWFHNLSDAYVQGLRTPDGVNPWMHIMRHPELRCMDLPKGRTSTLEPALVRDVREWPSATAHLLDRTQREGLCSICSWPLSRAGRVIGAVACYYDEPHVCSAPEQEVVREFALHASALIGHRIAALVLNTTGAK